MEEEGIDIAIENLQDVIEEVQNLVATTPLDIGPLRHKLTKFIHLIRKLIRLSNALNRKLRSFKMLITSQ